MKYTITLFFLLSVIVSTVKAEVPAGFDKESISNTVAVIKQKAQDCNPKNNEDTCKVVLGRVSRFCDEVTLAEKEMDSATGLRVRSALLETKKVITEVKGKIADALDHTAKRLERAQARSKSGISGSAYGIDLAEANSLVINQFTADIKSLDSLLKRARELEKVLDKRIETLTKSK